MFESLKYNLKHNRKSTMKNMTAWFLFSAIILVFAFFGLTPENQAVGQGGAVATVNDAMISQAQLAETVDIMRRDPRFEQFQALPGDAGRQFMQQQALSQLIERELIRQRTDRDRLWTTDEEVRDVIVQIPAFQEDGRFRRDRYMGYLQQVRKTPGEFEADIRKEQALRRTVEMFRAALKPLPLEAEKRKLLGETKANLEFAVLKSEEVIAPSDVKASEKAEFLAANEAKAKEYFEQKKAEFSTPEQVRARHILVKSEPGNEESEKKALAKAQELAKRAKTEDFAKLAKENSDDPGSKIKGGDLGFFDRGKMVPEFEQVAFTIPANQVSEPVKSQFGYHVIQVLEKKAAKTSEFAEVKDDIAGKLIAKERSAKALEEVEALLKKGDAAGVNQFVAKNKLKWEETGEFGLDAEAVPKIGPNDELVRAAFTMTSEKPLATNLVRQGPMAYVVRYKPVGALKPKADKEDPMQNDAMMELFSANRRSEDSLRLWLDDMKKSAKIQQNAEIR